MRMRKWRARNVLLLALIIGLVHAALPLSAKGASARETHELVILFDVSTSMEWNDPGSSAPDSLKQLVGSLPSHWHVGLVTFHADVVEAIAPSPNSRALVREALDGTRYTDWTSSGVGFLRAMEIFSSNAANRTIVFVNDGEKAHMETVAATAEAEYLAETALGQLISSDILVHTIVVGNDLDIRHESIMGLAHATGGHLFEDVASEDLSGVVSRLAFDILDVSNSLVGTAQTTDSAGNFTVRLPAAGIDMARVLITGESAVDNVAVSGGGSNVEIQTGQRFAIVEITRPPEEVIDISFTTTGTSHAELILEWDLQLMSETVYVYEDEADPTEPQTQIQFWLRDRAGDNVLHNPFFSGRVLDTYIDGAQRQLQIEGGYLHWEPAAAEEDQIYTIKVNLALLGINTRPGTNAIIVTVEAPPPIEEPPPPETDYTVLIATVVGLVLAIILLICIFSRRKKKTSGLPEPVHPPTPGFDSKFEFTGKLNLYITRTPDDDADIPPQTFDLFRLGGKREISLLDILQKCRISSEFSGVGQIYFSAGKQGSINVTNDSDCTVLIGRDLLMKKRSRALHYGEKVHVTCEDEVTELELHYKSVKPSEKHADANPLIHYAG